MDRAEKPPGQLQTRYKANKMNASFERAKTIYKAARLYSRASFVLDQQAVKSEMERYLVLPSLVNAALSLELYFKSLYLLEYSRDFKVKNKHSHDFHLLYGELSKSIKQEIETEYNRNIKDADLTGIKQLELITGSPIKLDLPSILKNWSGVFVRIRYFFDKNDNRLSMIFFPEIEKALVHIIKRQNPDW